MSQFKGQPLIYFKQIPNRTIKILTLVLLVLGSIQAVHAHFPGFTDSDSRPSLAPVLAEVKDAVVNISIDTKQKYRIPWFDQWPGFNRNRTYQGMQSAGSGVVIDAERGLVVTNHHVIERAVLVEVTLQDNRTFAAEILGSDPATDLSLLQIEGTNLVELTLADSDTLEVGDFVMAIGNPFGIGQTVTSGIVSALGRNQLGINVSEDFIQTDASINPGNSGGALIDIDGQLVGINSAIISPSGSSSGIGFAIPTNMVTAIIGQLIEYGDIKRGVFGIEIMSVDDEIASAIGLSRDRGVVVTEVKPGSGADQAGIRIDDLIIAMDGKEITQHSDLQSRISLLRVGQEFNLTVIRNNEQLEVEGKVQDQSRDGAQIIYGVWVSEIPPSHPLYGKVRGVAVASLDNQGYSARSFRVGDVITQINRTYITKVADVRKVKLASRPMALSIIRGTQQFRIFLQ